MDQTNLLDENLYKTITKCFINIKHPTAAEIFVIYSDGARETIWTFNPMRHEFEPRTFVGMTKIESVFYCDRRKPKSIALW